MLGFPDPSDIPVVLPVRFAFKRIVGTADINRKQAIFSDLIYTIFHL